MTKLNGQSKKPRSVNTLVYDGLILIILCSAAMRYGLLNVPLERDEDEYAYAGQLILNGFLPYRDLYSMKLPGIYGIYSGIMSVFGQTACDIHLGLLLINSGTIVLVFLLGKRFFNQQVGLLSAAFFAVLSLSHSAQGVSANTEHFVIFFQLAPHCFCSKNWMKIV